jgi:Rrf2 family protein
MNDLRDGGFVEGQRGRNGGYRLARPAEQISLGQIVRHIEGPLAPIACASHTAYERCSCPDEANCGLRMLMLDVRNAISDILDRHTLSSVVQVAASEVPFLWSSLRSPAERIRLIIPARAG